MATKQQGARTGSWGLFIPLVLFLALAGLFWFGLSTGDPSKLPSALIGRKVPEFSLPPLDGLSDKGRPVPGFSSADLEKGEVSVVNVWASWCGPCREEHPHLMALAKESGAPVYGLNYKDGAAAARRFLGRFGSPFTAVGVDKDGKAAIDWGVYGVPETFIVSGEGRILHKHVGPLDAKAVRERFLPMIRAARGDKE